jgi:hypothetical protein
MTTKEEIRNYFNKNPKRDCLKEYIGDYSGVIYDKNGRMRHFHDSDWGMCPNCGFSNAYEDGHVEACPKKYWDRKEIS